MTPHQPPVRSVLASSIAWSDADDLVDVTGAVDVTGDVVWTDDDDGWSMAGQVLGAPRQSARGSRMRLPRAVLLDRVTVMSAPEVAPLGPEYPSVGETVHARVRSTETLRRLDI